MPMLQAFLLLLMQAASIQVAMSYTLLLTTQSILLWLQSGNLQLSCFIMWRRFAAADEPQKASCQASLKTLSIGPNSRRNLVP